MLHSAHLHDRRHRRRRHGAQARARSACSRPTVAAAPASISARSKHAACEALFAGRPATRFHAAASIRIKAGDTGDADAPAHGMHARRRVCNARGAEAVIAACTEVPLVVHADALAIPLISSTDALVRARRDSAQAG